MSAPNIWTALSDDGVAQMLADRLAGRFLWHQPTRRWYVRTEEGYRRDDTLLLTWEVRKFLRELVEAGVAVGEFARTMLSARKIKNVEFLLKADVSMAADPKEWRGTAAGLVRR